MQIRIKILRNIILSILRSTAPFAVVLAALAIGYAYFNRDTRELATLPETRIALQFGLGYAPLNIAKEKELIPNASWAQFGSGGAIREALIAGELDIGAMGIPPALIGINAGAPWTIEAGLCQMPLGLQSMEYDDLADFGPADKIALPSPGSIQHILLSMYAQQTFGDPNKYDGQIIAMAHPDGAAALLTGQIAGHFTSPPYIFQELDAGAHWVVDGYQAFGDRFTFLVVVVNEDFKARCPECWDNVLTAIKEAITLIENDPDQAAEILAPAYDLEPATVKRYLTWPDVVFSTEVLGVDRFTEFMTAAGYLE